MQSNRPKGFCFKVIKIIFIPGKRGAGIEREREEEEEEEGSEGSLIRQFIFGVKPFDFECQLLGGFLLF